MFRGKPIYLLVERGQAVLDKLLKMADGVEVFDRDSNASLEAATARLVERIKGPSTT